jgi:DNA-binding LytR/AlgR family response regulator
MNVQCMIVDDEPHAIKVLESYITRVDHLEMVATCPNAIGAFDILRRKKIDVLFLDIKMPVISGVEFLRSLLNPPKVIFTTAFRDYAIDGFELDAVDFLLKPISFDRFLKAVDKLNRQLSETIPLDRFERSTDYVVNKDSFLYFKIEKSMRKILVEEILYVESAKDYSKLFLVNGKSLTVKQSISALEHILSSHRFVRIHRSYIAAINKISAFTPIQITTGQTSLPIGRLYKSHVIDLLQHSG